MVRNLLLSINMIVVFLISTGCGQYKSNTTHTKQQSGVDVTSQPIVTEQQQSQNSQINAAASDEDAALERALLSLTADATVDGQDISKSSSSPSPSPSPSPSASPGSVPEQKDAFGKCADALFKLKDQIIAKILAAFDADKNGKISKAEVINLIVAKQEKFLDKFSAVVKEKCADSADKEMSGRCQKLLGKFDADKDGKLSDAEIAAIEKAKLEKMNAKKERWVMSVAARLCLNNANLCEQALVDEVKAASNADQNALPSISDRLQKLIGKFLAKDRNKADDKPESKDDKK